MRYISHSIFTDIWPDFELWHFQNSVREFFFRMPGYSTYKSILSAPIIFTDIPQSHRLRPPVIYMCIQKDFHHWKSYFYFIFFFRQMSPIVNTAVLRHCQQCEKFMQAQCTLEYTLYSFALFPTVFGDWFICTLLLLSLEAHFAPLSFTNLAHVSVWFKEDR